MDNTGSSECRVKGRYRDAEIQWTLDGRPLTSSPTTNVTLNDSTGLYHFISKLITELNGTSSPTCTVKAKDVSTIVTDDCRPGKGLSLFNPEMMTLIYSPLLLCIKNVTISYINAMFYSFHSIGNSRQTSEISVLKNNSHRVGAWIFPGLVAPVEMFRVSFLRASHTVD